MIKIVNNIKTNILNGGYKIKNSKYPTLLLLHGAGMNATVWQMQTRYLANKGINTLGIDLPGHGTSDGKGFDSIEEMSLWVIQLMDELNINSSVIVGHSMGSLIGIETAKQVKNRIKGLILLGSSSSMPVHPDLIEAAKNNLLSAAEMITDWSFSKKNHIGGHPLPGYWMIDSSVQLIMASTAGILAKDLIACNKYKNILEIGKKLKQKVFFISGREDRMTPAIKAKELSSNIQNSSLTILNECGHMMMIEKPQEVTNLIYNFVKNFDL
tara:strand:+ start:16684 stop:17490 length:807 start_codon:yes stop_codon:yes gene_type:complete